MAAKRVLLACPRFGKAHSWLEAIERLPETVVIGRTSTPLEALLQATAGDATVVIVDLPSDGSDPGLPSHLLEELPEVKVVAVSADGRDLVLYRREIVRTRLEGNDWLDPERLTRLLE